MKPKFMRGVLLILLAASAWGMGGVAGQYLYQYHQADATWLVMTRQILAGLIFLGFLALRGGDVFSILRRDFANLLAYSFLGVLGAQLGYYYTISLSNAATGTVLQYTAPVFVLLWVAWQSRALPEKREIAGIFFALTGVFMISTHGSLDNFALSPVALLTGLISSLSYAYYTIKPVEMLKKYPTLLLIGWGQLLSGLALLAFRNPLEPPGSWDLHALGAFLYLLLGATIASYSLYLTGLKIVGPAKASLISCAEPLASIIAVVVLLHTPLTPEDYLGMGCIIFTVMLLSLPKK